MTPEQFARNLAHEITLKQHKVLDGHWPGLDMAAVIEVRVREYLKQLEDQK